MVTIIIENIDMMKKFKLVKLIWMTTAVLLISTVSCKDDFLEVAPAGSLSETELATLGGLEGSLIATYAMLVRSTGFYDAADNWFWGSVLGGDANKGTDPGDQSQVNEIQTYATQTNNASVNQKYSAAFEGVARANNTLKLVALAEGVSDENKTRITGEARFLRGHYYFDLKRNFDDVPYVDENWDGVEPVPNNQSLYPFIEADFQFAFDNLPETQSDAGRANKWAAGAYLGKALLFQGKWAEAKAIFDQVIANGVTASGEPYGLYDDYSDNFRSIFDNGKESVFAAQAAAGTGNIQNANPAMVLNFPHGSSGPARPGGCCGFFQPSFDLVNSYRTENGLPLLDGSYNSASEAVDSDMGLASDDPFTVDAQPIDPRVDHAVGRRGIPYLDWGPHPGSFWIRNQPNGGPYSPKKFSYFQEGIGIENDVSSWTPGYTAVNYSVIRYADVLLMAAEAEIELGNLDAGLALINQVRARAASSTIAGSPANYDCAEYGSFASQDEARTALRMERKLELAMEGHRFYDLVRWGIAADVLNDYLTHENQFIPQFVGATFTPNQDEFLPIPQNEIDLLGTDVLVQNPGY